MQDFDYYRPATPQAASEILKKLSGSLPKGGGTDLIPRMQERIHQPPGLVNLLTIPKLSGIREGPGSLEIGATTTIAALARSGPLLKNAPAVAEAAAATATPLIRNRATLGGNLAQRPRCWYFRDATYTCLKKGGDTCFAHGGENKYHAVFNNSTCAIVHPSNLAPALWAHDATVHLLGPQGPRKTPLEDFFIRPDEDIQREVRVELGELITAVSLKPLPPGAGSSYVEAREKLSFDWALVNAACRLDVQQGRIRRARLVLSAVAPTPLRLKHVEALLQDSAVDEKKAWQAGQAATSRAHPLSQNNYKLKLIQACVAQAILNAWQSAGQRS